VNFVAILAPKGFFCFKQHIARRRNVVSKCNKATEKASGECKKALEGNTEKKSKKRQHDQYVRDDVLVSSSIGEEVYVGISLSDPNKVGPIPLSPLVPLSLLQ
jgi:hypothetical protein